MKKLSVLLLFVPLFIFGQQGEPQMVSLKYDGVLSVRDQYVAGIDTLVKPGSFSENTGSIVVFFNESIFQIGAFASFSERSGLVKEFNANISRDYNAGVLSRISLSSSDLVLGLGYFSNSLVDYGYNESYNVFRDTISSHGLVVPANIIISQEEFKLFPKLKGSANASFSFSDKFSDKMFDKEKNKINFSLEANVYRVDLLAGDFYLSPTFGFSKNEHFSNLSYGLVLASNQRRLDIVKISYFNEVFGSGIKGIEGVSLTVDLGALISIFVE